MRVTAVTGTPNGANPDPGASLEVVQLINGASTHREKQSWSRVKCERREGATAASTSENASEQGMVLLSVALALASTMTIKGDVMWPLDQGDAAARLMLR